MDRTFSIIKPDATKRNLTGSINSLIEKNGLRIIAQKRIMMSVEQAEKFYEVHKDKPFFSDLVKSQLDPLLRSEYERFVKDVESHVKRGVEPRFAREKLMMTLYKHSQGLDLSSVYSEFGEILTKAGVELIKNHEVFTIEEWLLVIDYIESQCPAFFRMIGRIEEDLSAGRKSIKDDIIFEVDMENVVHGKANLFTYMHNLSDETRTVVLRVQSPDFRPHDIAMTYRLIVFTSYLDLTEQERRHYLK